MVSDQELAAQAAGCRAGAASVDAEGDERRAVNVLGALVVVAGFLVILHVARLVPKGVEITSVSRTALAVVRDPDLDDDAKAALMQRQAKRLFMLVLVLTCGGAAALLVPVGLIYALDVAGLFSFDGVMATLMSWQFLLATSVGSVAIFWAIARP
jgi:hypothetical protein